MFFHIQTETTSLGIAPGHEHKLLSLSEVSEGLFFKKVPYVINQKKNFSRKCYWYQFWRSLCLVYYMFYKFRKLFILKFLLYLCIFTLCMIFFRFYQFYVSNWNGIFCSLVQFTIVYYLFCKFHCSYVLIIASYLLAFCSLRYTSQFFIIFLAVFPSEIPYVNCRVMMLSCMITSQITGELFWCQMILQ